MRIGFLVPVLMAVIAVPALPALGQGIPKRAPVTSVDAEEPPPPPTEPSIPNAPSVGKASAPPKQQKVKAAGEAPARKRWPGKEPTGPVPLPPSDVQLMMLRGVLAAFNQANFTDNYTVLHGLMTPPNQQRLVPAQLSRAFLNMKKLNIDLSPVLILSPQFTEPPSVSAKNELRLVGFFPTRPQQVEFSIVWKPFDNIWFVDTLTVSVKPAPAVASAPAGPSPILSDPRGVAPQDKPAPSTPPAVKSKSQ